MRRCRRWPVPVDCGRDVAAVRAARRGRRHVCHGHRRRARRSCCASSAALQRQRAAGRAGDRRRRSSPAVSGAAGLPVLSHGCAVRRTAGRTPMRWPAYSSASWPIRRRRRRDAERLEAFHTRREHLPVDVPGARRARAAARHHRSGGGDVPKRPGAPAGAGAAPGGRLRRAAACRSSSWPKRAAARRRPRAGVVSAALAMAPAWLHRGGAPRFGLLLLLAVARLPACCGGARRAGPQPAAGYAGAARGVAGRSPSGIARTALSDEAD